MYRSVLKDNEQDVFSDECDFNYIDSNTKTSGRLVLTSQQRLVFLTKIQNSRYKIEHEYSVDDVDSASVTLVNSFLSKKLALSIKLIDSKSHSKIIYSHFKNTMPGKWVDAIQNAHSQNKQKSLEILTGILKSHERTSFDEVFEICKKSFYLQAYVIEGISPDKIDVKIEEILMKIISTDKVEGFIDRKNRLFVHKVAYQQKTEIIQYQVATSFEFGQDGTISLKCPSCGASKPQKDKSTEVVCEYCHSTYVVPKKVLDLI